MSWYVDALKKYAVFNGRSRRREYWVFSLCNLMVFVVFVVIQGLRLGMAAELAMAVIETLFFLAVLIPALAVAVRRLHDTGRSGWWLLIGFVPIVGLVVLIVFLVLDSQTGENRYGPNPKGIAA